MEILIQSLVGIADHAELPIHVRYLHMKGESVEPSGNGVEHLTPCGEVEGGKKKSLVVIRQPYAFLQSAIKVMFEGAEDVEVIVDRRFHERRRETVPIADERRGSRADRRKSSPMLDVLINIDR